MAYTAIAFLLIATFVVWRIRRWGYLTPEERRTELLERRVRRLEREQHDNRYHRH